MSETIRYSRMTDFMQLLHMMMAEPNGISLDDICEEFGVSRRTAERMRDAILNGFSQVDVICEENKVKRWGFIDYSIKEIIEFTDDEIEVMQNLKNSVYVPKIKSILIKMKALRKRK